MGRQDRRPSSPEGRVGLGALGGLSAPPQPRQAAGRDPGPRGESRLSDKSASQVDSNRTTTHYCTDNVWEAPSSHLYIIHPHQLPHSFRPFSLWSSKCTEGSDQRTARRRIMRISSGCVRGSRPHFPAIPWAVHFINLILLRIRKSPSRNW